MREALCEIAAGLLDDLRRVGQSATSEEDVRVGFESAFRQRLNRLGLNYDAKYERSVFSGRVDALFRRLVIEYKAPGKIASQSKFAAVALGVLENYVKPLAQEFREDPSSYAAVVTDGLHVGFARLTGESASCLEGPFPVGRYSVKKLLQHMCSLKSKALTPGNVLQDFGPRSDVAKTMVVALWQTFCRSDSERTKMFFREWRRLFGQVSGFGAGPGPARTVQEEAQRFGVDISGRPSEFVFVLHTCLSLFIKILALFVLEHVRRREFAFERRYVEASDVRRKELLEEVEDGGAFRRLGVLNFLEGDFFCWYINEWTGELSRAVERLLLTLSEYEPSTPALRPEAVRDLLKILYENILPKRLRHDLGEYYTPDWLAEYVLDISGMSPSDRVLDPTCGSGTFLVLAINRKRRALEGLDRPSLLNHILETVYGFDLNPLAVIASRTNYLLAINDLLEDTDANIEIPVYLADAVFSPEKRSGIYSYVLDTDRGRIDLTIPESVITKGMLGRFLVEVERSVMETSEGLLDEEQQAVLLRQQLEAWGAADAGQQAVELYRRLLELERQGWNRIWCRVIGNYFASVCAGEFDVIVGNPPWLRWSCLPEAYRNLVKPFCLKYGLFSSDRYVGGIESDISTMVLYTSAERWLKNGGRLAFLITRTVFKTESSEGFRRFRVPNGDSVQFRILRVEDLTQVRPFEGAKNKPAVVFLEKGQATTYPVPWIEWRASGAESVTDTDNLARVISITRRTTLEARPVYPDGGPWLTLPPEKMRQAMTLLRGMSSYSARKGICTDCNGVYYGMITGKKGRRCVLFENASLLGRREVESSEHAIEKALVFPVARGREVTAFAWRHGGVYCVLPQNSIDPYSESVMKKNYPNALVFFREHRRVLETRASYRRYQSSRGAPFYACWNVGPYTFAPYKVAWREIAGSFGACVLSSVTLPYWEDARPVVPDHKLYFIPLDDEMEAHYVCAFLNAPQVEESVLGYVETTQIGAHVAEYVTIPKWDPRNPEFVRLAEVSRTAHAGQMSVSEARAVASELVEKISVRE